MSISPSAWLDYAVVVHRSADGVWLGHADARRTVGHAGLAGNEPRLELSDGLLRLHRTDVALAGGTGPVGSPRPAVRGVSFRVGRLETLLDEGDRLLVRRGPTGDLGLWVVRQGTRIAGFGAVTGHFTPTVHATEDPRVFEEHLYHLHKMLADPAVCVVWLDVDDPQCDRLVESIPDLAPGGRMLVLIAGGDAEARRRVNHRVGSSGRKAKASSGRFVDIDARFRTEAEWRAYIEGLPRARPDDVYIRFTIDDVRVDVRERHYAEQPPWQLYVHSVYRQGVPGDLSHVGIVQASLGMTQAAIVETTDQIADGRIGVLP
jgi:hypothetical protein